MPYDDRHGPAIPPTSPTQHTPSAPHPHSTPHTPSTPASPISERQLAANRENAQRSTGPKTPGGKARSAFNGLNHGLFARDVVLAGEDREAYDALLDAMFTDLAPQGDVEEGLARRAADLWWRLGRTAAIEAGFLTDIPHMASKLGSDNSQTAFILEP